MTDIITVNNQLTDTQFPAGLISQYIAFIDRTAKTAKTYITNLKQFCAYLTANAITAPKREDIISYRQYLEAAEYKPNTVKQYLQSVRQFFSWTAAAGLYPNIAANIHAPKVRTDIHRKDALTAAEVLSIEQSIQDHAAAKAAAAATAKKDAEGRAERATEQGKRDYALYVLAVNAGLRTIELSRANVKDIEVKGGRAVIYIWGKGHSEPDARKPLAPEVYSIIKDYIDSRKDRPTGNSPLFVSTGNRSGGQRIAETTISKLLKKAMQQAGYDSERITAHTLRHTAGTNVQEITNDLYLTQKYMRHANPATTEIYLHNKTEDKESDIAEKLYQAYHSIPNSNNIE